MKDLERAKELLAAGEYVSGIINRRGDGPCPFEATVLDIADPEDALAAIRLKMQEMRRSSQ